MKLKYFKELNESKYASTKKLQLNNSYFIEDDIYIDRRSRTVKLLDEENNEYYMKLIDVLHHFKPLLIIPWKDEYREFAISLCIIQSLKKVMKIGVDDYEYRSFDKDEKVVEREITNLYKWTKRFKCEIEDLTRMDMENCVTYQFVLKEPLASILIKNKLIKVQERMY